MNTKHLIAAAAIALAGSSAFAQQELELQSFGAPQASTTTRAAVRAEAASARAAGQDLYVTSPIAVREPQKASGVTRAQVKAELAQARADGSLDLLYGNPYPFELSRANATRSAQGAAVGVQAGH